MDIHTIAPAFSFVLDKGFLQVAGTYRPQEFGNASIVLQGQPFSLRILRDRGQVFVEIGDDSVGWNKLEFVLEFVDSSITQQRLGEPPDSAKMAALLEGKWGRIADVFHDHKQLDMLQRFANAKTAELMNKIFPNPAV